MVVELKKKYFFNAMIMTVISGRIKLRYLQ